MKFLLTSPDLTEYANIHANDDDSLGAACEEGHLDIVQYLLTSPDLKEHADIHADDDYGFRAACENGDLDMVRFLLTNKDLKEHADIHADNDYGFWWACCHEQNHVIEYLMGFYSINELQELVEQHRIQHPYVRTFLESVNLKEKMENELGLQENTTIKKPSKI